MKPIVCFRLPHRAQIDAYRHNMHRNLPVACALLGVGVAPKLIDQAPWLKRARVAHNLVAILSKVSIFVKAISKAQSADSARVRWGAGEGVGRVNVRIKVGPAASRYRQGSKLHVILVRSRVVTAQVLVALDVANVVYNLVDELKDSVIQPEEVHYPGNDACQEPKERHNNGLQQVLASCTEKG